MQKSMIHIANLVGLCYQGNRCLPCYDNASVKHFFQVQSNILPSSESIPKIDSLIIANLCSYALSCITALV